MKPALALFVVLLVSAPGRLSAAESPREPADRMPRGPTQPPVHAPLVHAEGTAAEPRAAGVTTAEAHPDEKEPAADGPAKLLGITVVQPVVPVLVRKPDNPVFAVGLRVAGTKQPLVLESVTLSLAGTTRPTDVAELSVVRGGGTPTDAFGPRLGGAVPPAELAAVTITGTLPLEAGDNWFWVQG